LRNAFVKRANIALFVDKTDLFCRFMSIDDSCSAFAETRRKGEMQVFCTNSPKTIAPEQFKNAENCCCGYVFELFSRHCIAEAGDGYARTYTRY